MSILKLLLLLGVIFLPLQKVKAELPTFDEKPWLGYFAHYQGKELEIKVTRDADITISPMRNGEARPYVRIPFSFNIQQKLPNGKIRRLKIKPESLESKNEVTDKLRELLITGEAGKGAKFEIKIERKRETISLGGRITDAGDETRGPLTFHYQARFGHFYGKLLARLEGDQKEFDKIFGKDWIELRRLDKKKIKQSLTDIYEENKAAEVNGPGSSKVEIQAAIVDKNKRIIVSEATGSSALTLTKRGTGPYHEGYFLHWTADQEKDPKGKARWVMEFDDL